MSASRRKVERKLDFAAIRRVGGPPKRGASTRGRLAFAFRWLVFCACLASCGGPSASSVAKQQSSPSTEVTTQEARAVPGDLEVERRESPDEMPPRPAARAEPIESVAEAVDALSHGHYKELREYLDRAFQAAAPKERTQLLDLRFALDLEEGRYQTLREAKTTTDEQRRLRALAEFELGQWSDAARALNELKTKSVQARRAYAVLLSESGRQAEARAEWMAIIEAYNEDTIKEDDAVGLWQVAVAAHELGATRDANDAFAMATRADPNLPGVQVDWAKLFLEKYDAGHAEESLQAALAINPSDAEAHALMAAVKAEQGMRFDAVIAYAERALEINPNHIGAMMELASVALRDKRLNDVESLLQRAKKVNPKSPKLLALVAVRDFVLDRTKSFKRESADIRQQNPRSRYFARMLVTHAEWEHRYQEIIDFARATLASDPDHDAMRATLGLNLLRMGKEAEGLAELRNAWKQDRYNVRVYNTLNLYDEVLSKHYEKHQAPPFEFRFEKEESARLMQHVPALLRRSYLDMKKRYAFTPEGPIEVDLLADAESFAVRTVGLPRLGVQGVCFGKLITALSPKAAAFNWGQILHHELSHVFHLQMSKNRVPRWFTEGLAEYETAVAKELWKRHHERDLWQALENDKVPSIQFFDRAFTQIESAYELVVAYYASYRLVHYLIDTYSFDIVPKLLRGWSKGEESVALIERTLGKKVDAIDSEFRTYLRQDLARFKDTEPLDLRKLRGNYAALQAAAKRFPEEVALWELLIDELKSKEGTPEYVEAVRRSAELQPHSREAWLRWIELLHEKKMWKELTSATEFAILVDPHNPRVHALLRAGKARQPAPTTP